MIEQAQVGDTVRLTITRIVEGEVRKWKDGRLNVDGFSLDKGDRTVEILSRATPPLPDVPGTYWLDRDGVDVWVVEPNGKLVMLGGHNARAERYAPFRQLVLKEES